MRKFLPWIALASLLLPLLAHAADCQKLSEVCVEGPETRNVAGYPVYRDCWRTRSEYSCYSQSLTDDCQPLRDRGCSQVGSTCIDSNAQGTCMVYQQSFQCRVSNGTTSTITSCGSQQFCLDGKCFNTAHAPDADFAKAIAGLEAQREAGKYLDPASLVVFQGFDDRCRKKLGGLINCCKKGGSDSSLLSNFSLISGAAGQAWGAIGSTYTYDALISAQAPDMVMAGFEALFGAGGGASALAGLVAGEITVEAFITTLVPGPWTIVMIAIQMSGLLECEQAEQVLGMKRDNRLCHAVGSYCSIKLPIVGCVETKETYCCFNSRLSRILNEQGRPQLGKGWGTPESPDCSGFKIDQLQLLDFSRMNLSEFFAEIAPALPNTGDLQQRAKDKANSYFNP